MKARAIVLTVLVCLLGAPAWAQMSRSQFVKRWLSGYQPRAEPAPVDAAFAQRLSEAAVEQTKRKVVYDPAYFKLAYPGGDVPADRGVCTDVVIRAYRPLGIDLQVDVHEDMAARFSAYPALWGRSKPDPSIDHRRVPNLLTFFSRHGDALALSRREEDYQPGDIVAWDLGGGVTHIGVVIGKKGGSPRYLIVHNIGRGAMAEDVLFDWKIIGHFRYRR